jgi:hypothetical protein
MYQLALNGACPDVDIYLRDNLLDTGEVTPSPSGVLDPTTVGRLVRHYQSVDIKVDAPPFDTVDALVDGVEFDNPDHPFTRSSGAKIEDIAGITHNRPIRAQTNRVYVQVHNRGWKVASSVTVKVLYADAGAGLPALPNDFWPAFPGDAFDQTHWKPIGTTTITDLLPNVPRVLSWDWMPPATTSDHVCLLAMIDSPQDPLLPLTELNVDNLTLGNKRVTHRNVQPMDAPTPSGGGLANAWTSLYFSNGMAEHKFFDLRIENLTEQRCELRMILPAVQLREDLAKALTGFRARKLRKDELRQLVKIAREEGVVSDYVAKLATTLPNPILLEVIPGNATAELRGVLIPPGKRVPAVLTVACSPEATKARSPRFEVTQYVERRLIGGSEFIFNLVPTT